jgi:hypothetical protein
MHGEVSKKDLTTKYASQHEVYGMKNTHWGMRGVIILEINSQPVRFATQLTACKIPHKCTKEECPLEVVIVAEKCL